MVKSLTQGFSSGRLIKKLKLLITLVMKKINGEYPKSEILANAIKQLEEEYESWMKIIPSKISFLGGFRIKYESMFMMDICLKSALNLQEKDFVFDPKLREKIENKCSRLCKNNYSDDMTSVHEVKKIGEIVKEIVAVLKNRLQKYNE